MHKTLLEIHEDVPADHYDKGIKTNICQRYWHSRRFSEISKLVKVTEGPVLDLGCHAGKFTQVILKKAKAKSVYGVDISKEAIALAKKRIPGGDFKVADASKLPFKNDFFSAVYCMEMLEHVDSPLKVLKEIKRVLKKDGYGIILVPSDNKLFKLVWYLWTMYYPVWRHAHVQSFSGKSLEEALTGLKFKINQVKYFNLGMLKAIIFSK